MKNGVRAVASIGYGIDGNGRKIHAYEARGGRTYICPYCFEEIHVRKCYNRDDYFAHKSISNRTPQQMICPGYTGGGKKSDSEDELYIVNGGVPLHLVERKEQYFELIALFPPLSQENMSYLTEWDAKVEITGDGVKEIFSASNLRRYRIKTANEWINVNCTNIQGDISEVRKKWEWGIRGLAFDNDLFMSDFGGGCRIAQHSNIVIGKEYLIVSRFEKLQNIRGINFEKKGTLTFNNMSFIRDYEVYSLMVFDATDEAIAFIQSKGYQLIEKNDEIIPLWPPVVIEGKELIFKKGDNEAILYHEKQSKQEIYSWDRGLPIHISEQDNLIKVQTNNKAIIISDYVFNSFSKEIRFFLTQDRENYNIIKSFEPNMRWKDKNGIEELIGDTFPDKLYRENISVIANSRVLAIISQNGYVEKSSSGLIDKIKRGRTLFIDNAPFGMMVLGGLEEEKKEISEVYNDVIINECVNKLYHCQSHYITVENALDYWIVKAKEISDELYKILLYWKSVGKMPNMVEHILKELETGLYGRNN